MCLWFQHFIDGSKRLERRQKDGFDALLSPFSTCEQCFFAHWVPTISPVEICHVDFIFILFFCQSIFTFVEWECKKPQFNWFMHCTVFCVIFKMTLSFFFLNSHGRVMRKANHWQQSLSYHQCRSSAWVWTFYLFKSFQKEINGKCVNIFQHWYTCCTVAHVFYVNMLPRGSSLKTDVKFNTCLTNKINVRFFVRCQLLFNACVFATIWEKKEKKIEQV